MKWKGRAGRRRREGTCGCKGGLLQGVTDKLSPDCQKGLAGSHDADGLA